MYLLSGIQKTVLSISVTALKMLDKTESIKSIASTSLLRYISEIKCDWMHTFRFKTEDLDGFNCSNKLGLWRLMIPLVIELTNLKDDEDNYHRMNLSG